MELLTLLYSATGIMFGIALFAQAWTLLKDESGAVAINLMTVATFTLGSVITLLYALMQNGDFYFIFCTAVCMVGNGLIFVLALYKRLMQYKAQAVKVAVAH